MISVLAVIPYKMWLGDTQFDGGVVLCKIIVYIFIVSKELSSSGDSQYVDWNLWIKHLSRDCVDMMFIAIIFKYQTYGTYELCIGSQSLSCFQSDCGGSELASKNIVLVSDDLGGRIFHYKWNSICIPWKWIFIRSNVCCKKFDIQGWYWIVSFTTTSDMLDKDIFIIHGKYICAKTYQPDTYEVSKIGYKY